MPEAVITGVGLVSPLGAGLARATRQFAAGKAAEVRDGGMYVDEVPLDLVPADRRARLGRLDRLSRFFVSASHLAVHDAELVPDRLDAERFGLSFGTGLGCLLADEEYYRRILEKGLAAASPQLFAYTVSSAAAGEVSIAFGIKGPNVTSHFGTAAGAGAIGYGADWIREGTADVVLAGGADVIGAPLVEALRDMDLLKGPDRARPFIDAVPGVCPAEAAVVFVLESVDHARRRGARVRARVHGWTAGFEPTMTRRQIDPRGITTTLRRALRDAGVAPSEVASVFASAHGTPVDAAEHDALREVLPDSGATVLAPKVLHGDCFGASSAVAAALAVGLWTYLPETIEWPGSLGSLRSLQSLQSLESPASPGASRGTSGTPGTAATQAAKRDGGSIVPGAALVSSLCYSGNVVGLVLLPA